MYFLFSFTFPTQSIMQIKSLISTQFWTMPKLTHSIAICNILILKENPEYEKVKLSVIDL